MRIQRKRFSLIYNRGVEFSEQDVREAKKIYSREFDFNKKRISKKDFPGIIPIATYRLNPKVMVIYSEPEKKYGILEDGEEYLRSGDSLDSVIKMVILHYTRKVVIK